MAKLGRPANTEMRPIGSEHKIGERIYKVVTNEWPYYEFEVRFEKLKLIQKTVFEQNLKKYNEKINDNRNHSSST